MELIAHVWGLKGLVYLNNVFIKNYKEKVKTFGVQKLTDKLKVSYQTIALYRKNKPIRIELLDKICKTLDINKDFAEASIVGFTQNLKNKYALKFPIKITPLYLRMVSMIVGDGTITPRFATWAQHYKHIEDGANFVKYVTNYEPKIRATSSDNIKVISIPRFFVGALLNLLGCNNIKSKEFFENVCTLPRDWQFQVFAQLVVDEGSPDQDFTISQLNESIRHGIFMLSKNLGYLCTEMKNGIYIKTESFPNIKKDFTDAKSKFGDLGGFWFKDERFEKACGLVKPKNSENLRLAEQKFQTTLTAIKNKQNTFTRKDLLKLTDLSRTPVFNRLEEAVKNKTIIKLNRNLYTFPENLEKIDSKWLIKSKEDKVLSVIEKIGKTSYNYILKNSEIGETQTNRAINNLLMQQKIIRLKRNLYQRQ